MSAFVDDPGSLEEVRRLREEILELKGGKCSTPITVVRTAIKLVRPRPCPVLKDMEQSQPEPRGGTGNGPTLQAGTA